MALDLHVAVRPPEHRDEPRQDATCALHVAGGEPQRERPARAAGETHEAGGVRGEVVERRRRRALGRAELHSCDQAAEVLIALAILHEQRQARAIGKRDLAAHDRLHARVEGRASEAGRAVHPVPVHQCHGGHLQACCRSCEGLGQLGAFEE